MNLYTTALATTFGRGSKRPVLAAYVRLCSLAVVAFFLGVMLSNGLADMLISTQRQHYQLFCGAIFIVQLAVLFTLLAALGVARPNAREQFTRWLRTLPISTTQLWLIILLPSFLLAGLALCLLAWPLGILFFELGIHPVLLLIGIVVGVASAFGITHGVPARFVYVQFLIVPIIIWTEYKLMSAINSTPPGQEIKTGQIAAFAILVTLLVTLFILSFVSVRRDLLHMQLGKRVRTAFLPNRTWYAKKILRASNTRIGFVSALVMSAGIAYIGQRQGLPPQMTAPIHAVLIAAFASDIRSLAAKTNPAEIAALRGTLRFFATELCASLVYAIVIALPFFAVSIRGDEGIPLESLPLLGLGLASGLFASTLIVPQVRDISGQFIATLLCVGIIFSLPQISLFSSLPSAGQAVTQLAIGFALLGAAVYIEYKRNRFSWRNYA